MKNELEPTPIDILLAQYLAGETDLSGSGQVEAWIAESEENKAYFGNMKKAWQLSGELPQEKFDTDAAWEKLQSRIHVSPKRKTNYTWAIAAGVALILGIALFFAWPAQKPVKEFQFASADAVSTDTLPDGSTISLNRNSTLVYTASFSEERNVTLTGEAFFEVHHDAAHPFTVHTPLMDIRVLGTSFNVRAYPNSDSVRVTVSTGRVRCSAGGDTVSITPGEYAVFHNRGKLRKGTNEDPNTMAYRTRIFHFNKTPLSTAVADLNAGYGSHIVIRNPKLNSCPLNADFKNETLDNILGVIETALSLTSKKEGNNIILDGPGCP